MTLTLAISTSSPALSLALSEGDRLIGHHHALIGRGHAEALVPAIAALVGTARPARVLVDVGPGSYTGIRIGIAAARALGLAWDAEVAGVTATALVAARAFALDPALTRVAALIDAGRGQVAGTRLDRSLAGDAPHLVPAGDPGGALAGAGAPLLAPGSDRLVHAGHPDAADARAVPPARWLAPTALYLETAPALLPA